MTDGNCPTTNAGGIQARPFIPFRQEFLRRAQLLTSEDVLARNCTCVRLANFKTNLPRRNGEGGRKPIIGVNYFFTMIRWRLTDGLGMKGAKPNLEVCPAIIHGGIHARVFAIPPSAGLDIFSAIA
jgi:hypothetical protein